MPAGVDVPARLVDGYMSEYSGLSFGASSYAEAASGRFATGDWTFEGSECPNTRRSEGIV